MFSVQCTYHEVASSRSLRLVNHSPVCRKAEIQTVPGCRPKPFWGVRRAPRAPHALCACNMRSAHVHALRACGGALRAPPPKKVENEISFALDYLWSCTAKLAAGSAAASCAIAQLQILIVEADD